MKNINRIILLMSLAAGLFFGCGKHEEEENIKPSSNTVLEDGIVHVFPYEYYKAFRNPMKGWREYFGPGYDKKRLNYPFPYGSLIKEYMQWNMMENVESDGVDKVIAYSDHRWEGVEKQNVKVIPRPYIVWMEPFDGGYPKNTYTKHPDDLNGWHWPSDFPPEEIPADVNTPITGGYFDPNFAERMKKLIKKLGEAWDNDPRVAYVEMGLIGEFGEHHDPCISTRWRPIFQDFHVDNRTWIPGIEKVLGDAFRNAFKNKKVMVRYAYDFPDYQFGIYWDSWAIDEEYDRGYLQMKALGDRWKSQPIGGEITWAWGSLYAIGCRSLEDCLYKQESRKTIVNQIRDLHCNHLGGVTWANFNNNSFLANAGDIQKILGYHFVLKEFKYPAKVHPGEKVRIAFDVINTGSGPFYYDWPIEISLLDPESRDVVWKTLLNTPKVSTWMPGDKWDEINGRYKIPAEIYQISEDIIISNEIPVGKYAIAISVLDPAGNLPSLRFAVFNYWKGGRQPMGYIGVSEEIDSYAIPIKDFDDLQDDRTLYYEYKK